MKLEDIGFYTLSDLRARTASDEDFPWREQGNVVLWSSWRDLWK